MVFSFTYFNGNSIYHNGIYFTKYVAHLPTAPNPHTAVSSPALEFSRKPYYMASHAICKHLTASSQATLCTRTETQSLGLPRVKLLDRRAMVGEAEKVAD